MAKPPVLKPREVAATLERLGFAEVRSRGSHRQYRYPDGRGHRSHSILAGTFLLYSSDRLLRTSGSPLRNSWSTADDGLTSRCTSRAAAEGSCHSRCQVPRLAGDRGREMAQASVTPKTKRTRIPEKYRAWIDARKRFHLSHAHIRMARELGMNPKKLGKLANNKQEPWKAPLPIFIEGCYFKRFAKERPEQVRSIEELLKEVERRKETRRLRKELRRRSAGAPI